MNESGKARADIAERAVWTLLQAGTGTAVIAALDLSPAWSAVIAGGLAVVKGMLASQFGTGSAATLPTSVERS